jgi:fumarate reductase subunit D
MELAGAYLIAVLFAFVVLVLWILLPFAVFGTKDKLNQLISETKSTNQAMQVLVKEISLLRKQGPRGLESERQGGASVQKAS